MNYLKLKKPLIIAHRGASGYEPENTLLSFKKAIDMCAQMIELDVFLAHSGEIVVIHDPTIDRTTNGSGFVERLTERELKKYNAGKGQRIPFLAEIFDLVSQKAIINIELKELNTAKPVADLIDYYINHKNWAIDNFLISSFNVEAIVKFKIYSPKIETGLIFWESKEDIIKIAEKTKSNKLIVNHEMISKNLIDRVHANGLNIFSYTINDKALAENLVNFGIDGIITDYPDILGNLCKG